MKQMNLVIIDYDDPKKGVELVRYDGELGKIREHFENLTDTFPKGQPAKATLLTLTYLENNQVKVDFLHKSLPAPPKGFSAVKLGEKGEAKLRVGLRERLKRFLVRWL